MRASGSPKVVVLGMMTTMPVAGVVWQNLHYLLGFEQLGYEAYYVETHARTPSMLMSSETDDSAALAAEFICTIMRRFGLGDRWAFRALHTDGRCLGMSERKLERLYAEAELILNLHGGTRPLPELARGGRLIYLETDPVQLQLELRQGTPETLEFLDAHRAFFTFAENWGKPGCSLPDQDRFDFMPTRQPVVLDLWPDRSEQPARTFTTIGNWRQLYRDVNWGGERYTWSKHHEFLKQLDLPERTGASFELALSSCEPAERELLSAHGWGVRDALVLSSEIDPYRSYIGASRGEFTVAKDQNVRLRTGWFSDRSATYLASGRPVVTQDTGFSVALPTGEGLFAFDSTQAAVDAIAQVERDYEAHCRAAREMAREHFAHNVVLGKLLEHLGCRSRATLGPRLPATVFPPEIVIEPVSRRPTQLHPDTEAAAHQYTAPVHSEAPTLGRGSASIAVVTCDGLAFTRLCLETVLAHTHGDFELLIIDNGSRDGTPSYLVELARRDARVHVLLGGRNNGFAAACNRGLALARGEHLVLLNNDTMVPPGWLARLLAHLVNPEVGLVGPVTNRIGNEAEIAADYTTWGEFLELARRRTRRHRGVWLPARTPAMFCLAMRRDTYERLGPIDERYEIGMLEDDDYAERARAAGYEQRCVEDVLVHHFGEASFGRLFADGEHARILRANKRRYAQKWNREWQPYERRPNPDYEHATQSMRATVCATVPADATVLVVSRGDEQLLELGACRALHFPQTRDGSWAGHHPADSEEAIGHLEALRDGGAEYLVVPATYGWWLRHYEGLCRHLESRYESVLCDGKAAIYRLQEATR